MRCHPAFAAFAAASFLALPQLSLAADPPSEITFNLAPNPAVLDCVVKDRYAGPPVAKVIVTRGGQNDVLLMELHNIKPNLAFDMFTVQRSSLRADGSPDPAVTNFGLAWYQSDIRVNANGDGKVAIKTILLDQIFGFDPQVGLPPRNTFHVGFWFNNPLDATACGFDPSKPTPFNGEHKAGPLAMISLPDPITKLGPLCTRPVMGPKGNFGCQP